MGEQSQSDILERYRHLVSAMQEMAVNQNLKEAFHFFVNTAAKLGEAEIAWVLRPDPTEKSLIPEDGTVNQKFLVRDYSLPMETSLEGWVFLNQQVAIINDIKNYDQSKGEIGKLPGIDVRSIMALPVSTRCRQMCVLLVANSIAGSFSPLDREILSAFTNQAAYFLEKKPPFVPSDLIPELVHELRTPLAALNTALHLLQRPDLPDDKRDKISRMITTEFTRLSDLTTSFLDFARLESGKEIFNLTRFDLNQLISESVEIIQAQLEDNKMIISLKVPTEPSYVTADRDKIKQVVFNLLNNVIKYTDQGGIINVRTMVSERYISFSVEDNGQGISPEYLPHLFERFFRIPSIERQVKGSGLGLTISKQIVEAHHGRIDVSSVKGQGSKFTVQLPVNGAS